MWKTLYLNETTVFATHCGTHMQRFSMEWTTFTHKNKRFTLQFLQAFRKVMPPVKKLSSQFMKALSQHMNLHPLL